MAHPWKPKSDDDSRKQWCSAFLSGTCTSQTSLVAIMMMIALWKTEPMQSLWKYMYLKKNKTDPTFLGQASALSHPWLSVHQLALGTCRHCRCPPIRIPIVTEGVPPAWVPGGVLSQLPLGLRLETRLVDGVAGCGQPVTVDLATDVSSEDGTDSVVLVSRINKVAEIVSPCWDRN